MIQTLPQLRDAYIKARRKMIERHAAEGLTQTEAARRLGVSMNCLNNIIVREGIDWPVKRQGVKAE